MDKLQADDFVGRHLIVDASTYTRRNLSSTDTVFALFEALNRNLDMTEDNYYAFDAFSCRDFAPKNALRLLLTHFDVEALNCVNLLRHQRSIPRVSNFQVNAKWQVIVGGNVIGELDSVDFGNICGRAPAATGSAPAKTSGVSGAPGARQPGASRSVAVTAPRRVRRAPTPTRAARPRA